MFYFVPTVVSNYKHYINFEIITVYSLLQSTPSQLLFSTGRPHTQVVTTTLPAKVGFICHLAFLNEIQTVIFNFLFLIRNSDLLYFRITVANRDLNYVPAILVFFRRSVPLHSRGYEILLVLHPDLQQAYYTRGFFFNLSAISPILNYAQVRTVQQPKV